VTPFGGEMPTTAASPLVPPSGGPVGPSEQLPPLWHVQVVPEQEQSPVQFGSNRFSASLDPQLTATATATRIMP